MPDCTFDRNAILHDVSKNTMCRHSSGLAQNRIDGYQVYFSLWRMEIHLGTGISELILRSELILTSSMHPLMRRNRDK